MTFSRSPLFSHSTAAHLPSLFAALCPPTTVPAPLANHLASLSAVSSSPTPSPHVTFLTALYAERALSHVGEYVLLALGRVLERQPGKESAGLAELEAALAEDEALWKWVQGMRVRAYIEGELQKERLRSGGPVQGAFSSPVVGGDRRVSIDSVASSAKGLVYGRKASMADRVSMVGKVEGSSLAKLVNGVADCLLVRWHSPKTVKMRSSSS